MKKIIVIASSILLLTACKKGEIKSVTDAVIDSATNAAKEQIDETKKELENKVDSLQTNIKDKSMEELGKVGDSILKDVGSKKNIEKLGKEIEKLADREDSLSDDRKKKSVAQTEEKTTPTNEEPKTKPQIIKEKITKVIYKDNPKMPEIPVANTIKTADYVLSVKELAPAQENLTYLFDKYDIVKKNYHEDLSSGEETAQYIVQVPADKFDYFVEDLPSQVGKIVTKNVEETGSVVNEKSYATVHISLINPNTETAQGKSGFSTHAGKAMGSGWNAVEKVVLALLPFWPLYLLGGVGYYIYRRKSKKTPTAPEETPNPNPENN